METIDFAYNSELDFAHFFVAQPYIGTELYDIVQQEKLGTEIIQGTSIFLGCNDSTTMTADELNKIQSKASSGWMPHKIAFYLKPKNFFNSFLPKLKTWNDFRYALSIFLMLLGRNLKGIVKNRSN